ncbi:MAG: hypothetical protein A3F84_00740 [Candidatus Handelsmanbacteria bacterium RIFCSPLOWO2_12_FULL_64_10]|uniref:Uncharacterized protein n=1 Tax=Handelsmanbacteria sp. (strain RIFCSPLOWO2_12_FULL_64_10) TaxID=1817868 RepID=A0A1F6D3E5_HANXR|nr:MAG: hypothetical protein A3F84_00740 [Candidatus Handelsmanbacteria bacterium RIFCSPLOWO2_12_FULL_64_10]
MPTLDFKPIQHPGLILTPHDLDAIKQKVRASAWAKATFDDLIAEADRWTSEGVRIPDRKGQWMHFYACPEDGTHLRTISDTEHRCPACGKTYTGEPYDSVVIRNRHMALGDAAVDLGLAYHLTGDQKYLQTARQIVLGYADRYLSYPLVDKDGKANANDGGRVFCTLLNESNWLIAVCWAYDLIAPDLSTSERRHVCEDMLHPAGAQVIRRRNLKIHNIQCWMNSAMGLAALCCGDGELAHHAIRSETGLEAQLEKGILSDGLWWECSWGYHFYTMSALWPLTEAARQIGLEASPPRYKSLYDAPLRFAFPGLYLPPLNDSGSGVHLPDRCETYEIACARWRDPRHAGLLQNVERRGRLALCFGPPDLAPAPPDTTESVNFPAGGVAILRDQTTLVTLDYGPHGGGHGHPDKLGLILYGAGRVMAPDPGSIQYGVPLHLEWFKTTVSHNTVSVDMSPQKPCAGKLLTFRPGRDAQIASASADDAYPGVRFRRTLALLTNGIVLDLCELSSDEEHVYDYIYHNRGAFSSPLPLRDLSSPIGAGHGYQHIRGPRSARTDGDWTARWDDGDAGVCLAMTGAPGTEVITGIGPGNPPSEMLPLILARRRDRAAQFAVALVVYKNSAPDVQLSLEASGAKAWRVRVQVGDDSRTVELPRY